MWSLSLPGAQALHTVEVRATAKKEQQNKDVKHIRHQPENLYSVGSQEGF